MRLTRSHRCSSVRALRQGPHLEAVRGREVALLLERVCLLLQLLVRHDAEELPVALQVTAQGMCTPCLEAFRVQTAARSDAPTAQAGQHQRCSWMRMVLQLQNAAMFASK